MNNDIFKRAPHNPPHLFLPDMFYMITASIYQKSPIMALEHRREQWRDAFLKASKIYRWKVVAWVVLTDHYHAVVHSPENAHSLSRFVVSYHKYTSRLWNDEDKANGRKVWWNYWDTCIRSERDYYNRLQYVFWNPVKHGLTNTPEEYAFSNYKDFIAEWQTEFYFTNTSEVNDVPEF